MNRFTLEITKALHIPSACAGFLHYPHDCVCLSPVAP